MGCEFYEFYKIKQFLVIMREFLKIIFKGFKMLKNSVFLGAAALLLAGCGTLNLKEKAEEFQLRSVPSNAVVQIIDTKENKIIASGKTPYRVSLPKRQDFFEGKNYQIRFLKEGFVAKNVEVKSEFSGHYGLGNLVSSGPIGWFLVDPGSGAMWTLVPQDLNGVFIDERFLEVHLIEDNSKNIKKLMSSM